MNKTVTGLFCFLKRKIPPLAAAAALFLAALLFSALVSPGALRAEPAHPHPFKPVTPEDKHPSCADKPATLVIELQGLKLLLPRDSGVSLLLKDGTQLNGLDRPGPEYNCENIITDVRGMSTTAFQAGETMGNKTEWKARDQMHDMFLRLRANPDVYHVPAKITKLASGIETLPLGTWEAFFLPPDAAPTLDGAPVVFVCEAVTGNKIVDEAPRVCQVTYIHPSKLRFSYEFLRKTHPVSAFFEIDQGRRKLLDSMISGGKDAPTP